MASLSNQAERFEFAAAAVAGDHGGDAVEQEIVAARPPFHAAFDVCVNVDEAGGEDAFAGVDGARGGGVRDAPESRDAAVLHGEIRALPGISAAIDDAGVADQHIVIGGEER